ncbi:MAG: HNH endonuclease [Planctomycetes bacterium]|nr:HNH endonuclease [Planctomycetota bacterium]
MRRDLPFPDRVLGHPSCWPHFRTGSRRVQARGSEEEGEGTKGHAAWAEPLQLPRVQSIRRPVHLVPRRLEGAPRGAAHLCPVSKGGSDDPRNGLVLCRNHHAALDAGALAFDALTTEVLWRTGLGSSELGVSKSDLNHLRRSLI